MNPPAIRALLAFVAGGLSNDLTAIATATIQVLKTIPVGQVPNAALVDD